MSDEEEKYTSSLIYFQEFSKKIEHLIQFIYTKSRKNSQLYFPINGERIKTDKSSGEGVLMEGEAQLLIKKCLALSFPSTIALKTALLIWTMDYPVFLVIPWGRLGNFKEHIVLVLVHQH